MEDLQILYDKLEERLGQRVTWTESRTRDEYVGILDDVEFVTDDTLLITITQVISRSLAYPLSINMYAHDFGFSIVSGFTPQSELANGRLLVLAEHNQHIYVLPAL